jgi:predicted membrane protein
MANSAGFRLTPQLVLGLGVIVIGLLFTLDNLDIVPGRVYLRFWPVALIAVGLAHLSQEWRGPRVLIGSAWLLAGVGLLLENLGILHIHFWDLWPLLFVAVGAYLVWQSLQRRQAIAGSQANVPAADSASTINAVAIMSGVVRRSNSPNFRGGELTAVMGGCEIDLRKAAIVNGDAVIDTFAFWGGIEIIVPENWTVIGQVHPFMAGYEDKTRPPKADTRQRLVIRGLAIMGGIEVHN